VIVRATTILVLCLLAATATVAQEAPPPPKVTVAKPVEREVTDFAEFTGRFEAVESVTMQAQVTGYLSEIHFTDGQLVEQGDLLFVIDPRPFEAVVASARAAVASAQANAELTQLELERGEQLVTSGAVSREAVDTRRANQKSAAAALTSARADLQSAELSLAYTRIAAPVAGRISATEIDIGNLVLGGTTVLTSIVSVAPIYFTFDVSEGNYLKLVTAYGSELQRQDEAGSIRVSVKVLDDADFLRTGAIDFIDNAFDASTGTIRMRARFDNADGQLLPGLFGKLRMASSQPYRALLIPDTAVMADQSNRMVMTVGPDGTVAAKQVEIGPLDQGLRVVTSGLAPSDMVIIQGQLMAHPGQKVTPEEAPAADSAGSGS